MANIFSVATGKSAHRQKYQLGISQIPVNTHSPEIFPKQHIPTGRIPRPNAFNFSQFGKIEIEGKETQRTATARSFSFSFATSSKGLGCWHR